MMALQAALLLVGPGLAVGEGVAWISLSCLVFASARVRPRPPFARWLLALRGQALALGGFLLAGLWASALGPYGLSPGHALGHWLPALVWPGVYAAGRAAGGRARRLAFVTFVAGVLACVLLGYGLRGAGRGAAESWVRLDAFVGEQGFVPGTRIAAATGLYFHRLKMAHVLLVALGPALASCLLPTTLWGRRIYGVAAASVVVVFCVLALGLTFARAAYLAAAVAAAGVWAAALWHRAVPRNTLWRWAAAAACLVAALAVLRPDVLARALSSSSGEAAEVRAIIWSQAVRIVEHHPWGVGLGNYPQVVARYYAALDPMTLSPRTYPHSLIWMAWAEAGPLGALGWAAFWAQSFGLGWRAMGQAAPRAVRRAGCSLVFVVIALGTVGLTHDVLFHNIVALAFFAALGLAQAEVDGAADEARDEQPGAEP